MPVFAVIRQSDPEGELARAIEREFADAHYDLGLGTWLVAGAGTAQEVSKRLGVTPDAASGSAVIVEAASYYGRANPAIWTWIKENWERKANG